MLAREGTELPVPENGTALAWMEKHDRRAIAGDFEVQRRAVRRRVTAGHHGSDRSAVLLRGFGGALRVGDRDELDTRAPLARLRIEVHEVIDRTRQVGADRDAKLVQRVDVERIVVRPLPVRERARDALRVRFRVMLGQELADRRVHLTERLLREVAEYER